MANRIVILTSSQTGVQVAVADYLLSNGFNVDAIIFEGIKGSRKRENFLAQVVEKLLYLWHRWGYYIFTIYFISSIVSQRRIKKKVLSKSWTTKKNKNARLTQFDTIYDLNAKHGVKIIQVSSLNDDETKKYVKKLEPQIVLCLAARILRRGVLELPFLKIVNLHSMTLPEFRGLSPVGFREILSNRAYFEINYIWLLNELDTGGVIYKRKSHFSVYGVNLHFLSHVAVCKSRAAAGRAINLIMDLNLTPFKESSVVDKVYTNPTRSEFMEFIEKIKNV
jgi:hypothetical protein